MIGVLIYVVGGDFSQLDSLGFDTRSRTTTRFGESVITDIPVHLLRDVRALSSVKHLVFDEKTVHVYDAPRD